MMVMLIRKLVKWLEISGKTLKVFRKKHGEASRIHFFTLLFLFRLSLVKFFVALVSFCSLISFLPLVLIFSSFKKKVLK